jgi:hypothetical protein
MASANVERDARDEESDTSREFLSRDELRAVKQAKRAAKRELREAHRLENAATHLRARAKHDPALQLAADAATALAKAAPNPKRLVDDAAREEAVHRCDLAIRALRNDEGRCGAAMSGGADALLHAMTKGTQTREMFNVAACEGYVDRKFTQRALLVFAALRQCRRTVPWAARALSWAVAPAGLAFGESDRDGASIVSIGGGPGCCLYGCALFEQLLREGKLDGDDTDGKHDDQPPPKPPPPTTTTTAPPPPPEQLQPSASSAYNLVAQPSACVPERPLPVTSPSPGTLEKSAPSWAPAPSWAACRLESWDFAASSWAPWCERVDRVLLGGLGRLSVRAADVTQPLEAQPELLTTARNARLVLLSYVLTETRGRWAGFVSALYAAARPGTLFLCCEPTDWQPKALLALLTDATRPAALRSAWLDVRSTAAPPSVLVVQKPEDEVAELQ